MCDTFAQLAVLFAPTMPIRMSFWVTAEPRNPQPPITHWRVVLPNPLVTMAHGLEVSLYRLIYFQRMPFFRPRPVRIIRNLLLHTLIRTLNQPVRHDSGNRRPSELLLRTYGR